MEKPTHKPIQLSDDEILLVTGGYLSADCIKQSRQSTFGDNPSLDTLMPRKRKRPPSQTT